MATQLFYPTKMIYVDRGGPYNGELIRERNFEEVPNTGSTEPDPAWSYVDTQGHYHAHSNADTGNCYPTLLSRSRHQSCNGSCGNADCEGWDSDYYVCIACAEEIFPGTRPGPPVVRIEGPGSWWVQILEIPFSETTPMTSVALSSIRIERRTGLLLFGFAKLTEFESFSDFTSLKFTGASPLGHHGAEGA